MQARFIDLPQAVDRMLAERGLAMPAEYMDGAAYMKWLDASLDQETLEALAKLHSGSMFALNTLKAHLTRRSTAALAIHLYAGELIKLVSAAGARMQLKTARGR